VKLHDFIPPRRGGVVSTEIGGAKPHTVPPSGTGALGKVRIKKEICREAFFSADIEIEASKAV